MSLYIVALTDTSILWQ